MDTLKTGLDKQQLFERKKIEILFDQAKVSILAVQAAVLLFAYFFQGHTQQNFLVAWTILFSLINVARYLYIFAFFKTGHNEQNCQRWFNRFLVGLFASGVMWSTMAMVAIPTDEINYTSFLILVIAGLLGGAVSTYAVSRIAYGMYAVSSTIPLVLILAIQSEPALRAFGLIVAIYFMFLYASMLRLNKMVENGVLLHFENLDLLYQLEREKHNVEEINQSLEADIESRKILERKLLDEKNEVEVKVDELSKMSLEDGLTQIMNRRGFNEFLEQEWQIATKYQNSISLIMLDIDFFKGYNDHYGHPAGDDVLYTVAQACYGSLRSGLDLIARYGGEEFIVILPKSEQKQACLVAEKLRAKIESLAMPHKKSKAAKVVTASFGVATVVPKREMEATSLVEQVDQALYSAKTTGRNRVYPCRDGNETSH
jgi:diguanylate cyclase (GGDEF)-like protein